ncbi:MAG TPA: 50S ribosomal protein L10 [Porphyromonadaceae bacterium]|jgi:large subunit ribosomal protein L10|uniref:50S ribosomal protein L10 n=1 Tax=Limibacterium fermenti TaxID=3229863 RepID=UPI000E8CEAF3|nr:50S ribosomal protein L10 [Porphyromonadaceae bacterium]HBL33900.1 50S ribosomal protein L10 [Porphyromonadaceae bacterium]HBX19441.1 50S ribosomal protein L10 [Porphyromonadaceae bacterium]HBX45052.1 50S ribosomal protein L10 [Porphyromonadaceae bacterium]HCM19462.1 50S ribosomal protein L10 [Porphyromonadaceae bacterium]
MKKEDKSKIIEQIAVNLQSYENFYLTDIATLNAAKTSTLRRECSNQDIKLLVVKNTLLHKAFESLEKNYEELYPALKGNTAIMFSNVANAPAKLIDKYKADKIPAFKAAYVQESFFIGEPALKDLVNIKSKTELIGEVIMLLQSPAKNVISALQSGGSILHGVLKTLSEKEN